MKMLVGSGWVEAADGKTMDIINPATGEFIDTVPSAGAEDVARAVDTAIAAQPAWAALTVRERVEKLRRFAELVIEHRLELGKILSLESGKPYLAEAVWEFDSVAYVFEGACEVAKHQYGTSMPIGVEPGYDDDIQFTLNEPLGVIACIIPFNFPPAIWSFKAGAALAAGNAIVVKAPEQNPMALLRCHELLAEAGVPAEVVQILTGAGETAGAALVSDPRVSSINFTGSSETGVSIARSAANNLTGYQFELGGNDPLIIFADADLDLAVSESGDKSRNSGQACSAAKRFIVHNSIKDEFVRRLIDERLKPLVLGDPMEESTTMGPLITDAAAKGVEDQVNQTVDAGATVAFGGNRNGAFYEPTVLTNVSPEMDIARDMEVFGPVWPIIGFDTVEEAIEIANGSHYGLGGGVITGDIRIAFKVVRGLLTGHVAVNGSGGFRAAELPFGGGQKKSGNSRESLSAVMSEVTQRKSVILRYVLSDTENPEDEVRHGYLA
jgi:succinate-semialdehyde dehydrogenase/glutarate-semialdehyde dehydrogenase